MRYKPVGLTKSTVGWFPSLPFPSCEKPKPIKPKAKTFSVHNTLMSFHGTPKSREIPSGSLWSAGIAKQLKKYLCPNIQCLFEKDIGTN